MDARDLSPGTIAAAIVVVIAIAGFIIWKETSVKPYTGPPINMGAAMKAGQSSGPGTAPAQGPGGLSH